MASDNQLEQMKQKYASVLTTIQQQQVQLSHVHIQDNKLFIEGLAPSEQAKNKVWDQIKLVNPNWAQEVTADISVDPNAKPAQAQGASVSGGQQRTYTVKPGDSLFKISKELYGNANEYMKIFEANRDVLSDPNKISPGQTLKIPG
ncbi:MAG TPA: LysM peptidoglycan-binding domain-containing protein [Terriglobales bacterium]|jgi:nucleoid-associated protein YgaU|nr:LysM peptidoglycan-binding domain-containing protein [Terriglobales bacterium]